MKTITTALALLLLLAAPALAMETRRCCDMDDDGYEVTAKDWGAFVTAFGKRRGQAGYLARADFDQDGVVGGADFRIFATSCPLD